MVKGPTAPNRPWLIDKVKAQIAATAIVDAYKLYISRTISSEQYKENQRLAEIAAFSKLRPELEKSGITFFTAGDGGGTILLSADTHGARLEVLGDRITLKLTSYSKDNWEVKPGLVSEFVSLFACNAKKD